MNEPQNWPLRHVEEHGDEMDLPRQKCRGTFASNAQGRDTGFKTFADYFTARQLIALTTFSDLVSEARDRVLADARAAGLADDDAPLHTGGSGMTAYADALATYLAFAVSKSSTRSCSLAIWKPATEQLAGTFGRQGTHDAMGLR